MENSESLSTITITYIGWLEFFLRIVEAIAWPTLILFLAIRYGKSIISLLPNMETLKVPGVEAVFKVVGSTREAAKAIEETTRNAAEAAEPANLSKLNEDTAFINYLSSKSDENPLDVMMQLHFFIMRKLDLLLHASKHRRFDDNHQSPSEIFEQATGKLYNIEVLWQAGWISDDEQKVIRNLGMIRGEAMDLKNQPITSILARESVRLAEPLIHSISSRIKEIETTAQPA